MLRGLVISCENATGRERRGRTLQAWQTVLDEVDVLPATMGSDLLLDDPRISESVVMKHALTNEGGGSIFNDSDVVYNLNQVGCALSHIRAWELVVQRNEPCVIIEDDVEVRGTRADLDAALRANANADYLVLDALCKPDANVHTILQIATTFAGMQAYWITPRGCVKLLAHALPVSLHIDRYIAAHVLRTRDESFHIAQPQLACAYTGGSTLSHIGHRRAVTIGVIIAVTTGLLVVAVLFACRSLMHRQALERCRATCGGGGVAPGA